MQSGNAGNRLTREELAWQLAEIFEELRVEELNEMLAKNVPIETLEFFASYADDFCDAQAIGATARRRVPNLMLLGYLLRLVEERLLPEPFDA
jgi:hypothetical protein